MNPLALGYKKLYDSQKKSDALRESKKDEFFGLRDFYRYEFITLLTLNLKALFYFEVVVSQGFWIKTSVHLPIFRHREGG